MLTYNRRKINKLDIFGKYINCRFMFYVLLSTLILPCIPVSFADSNSYDKSVTRYYRNGDSDNIPLDYSANINAPANYNEIFLSDVYLDHFDGKAVATFVFRVQKNRDEIIRGVGAFIKASPRIPLPDYIAQNISFEGYVYSIENTIPNTFMVRFPIRTVHDSVEYDLHIDQLAYYVDLQQAPYGDVKRLWVKNGNRDFTHEDIFTGVPEHWNSDTTPSGSTRETYRVKPDGAIFNAARKYYGCSYMFR